MNQTRSQLLSSIKTSHSVSISLVVPLSENALDAIMCFLYRSLAQDSFLRNTRTCSGHQPNTPLIVTFHHKSRKNRPRFRPDASVCRSLKTSFLFWMVLHMSLTQEFLL